MLDNNKYEKLKKPSEKSFGITFSIVFFIIFVYFNFIHNENLYYSFLILSFIFLYLSFYQTFLLRLPNKLWFLIGIYLGKIVSPIILFVIFFGLLTPISLITRIFKRDLINQKINKNKNSYWIKRLDKINNMKDQY